MSDNPVLLSLTNLSTVELLKLKSEINEILAQRTDSISVVHNTCYGGFSLSKEGLQLYRQLSGLNDISNDGGDIVRNDPNLVEVVKKLGKVANGACASLSITSVRILPGTHYCINEYDGFEFVKSVSDEIKD